MSLLPNPSAPCLSKSMTFGIELEIIVVSPKNYFKPEDAIVAISRALVAAGIDSTGHERFDEDAEIFNSKPEFSQWVVQFEGDLFLSETEEAMINVFHTRTQGVEISSRKFNFAEDWKAELETVFKVLYRFSQSGCKLITNATTGFHIHVGFGNENVEFRTAKSVLQLCTAFEDRLDALYATDRIDVDCEASAENGAHFNAGLAWHFQNNKATSFGPNVFHWLASIEEVSSHKELGAFFKNECPFDDEIMTTGHFSTVNIDNTYSDGHRNFMGTIEFRQHHGTLVLSEVMAHIELKRTIVTYCHCASDLEFLQLFSQVSIPNFTIRSLCQAIGTRREQIELYDDAFSVATEHAQAAKYHDAWAKLEDGKQDELGDLELRSFIESFHRSNRTAVLTKTQNKRDKGTYADLTTADFDVASSYHNFVMMNSAAFPDHQQLSTLARTMVSQQLNGSGSS